MVTLLHDVAVLHHKDKVCFPDGGKAVRHNKAGTALHHAGKSFLDTHLSAGIDGGCCFVQDQHRRQAEHHAGNAQQLLLALTDVAAVLGDNGVVALRQAADKAVCMGGFGCCHDLFKACIRLAVGNVFPHGTGPQPCILQHHAVAAAQGSAGHIPDVGAGHLDGTAVHIIEAHEQVDEGGLAAAGRADDGNALAGLYGEIQIFDQMLLRRVGERDVLQLYAAGDGFKLLRVQCVRRFGRLVDQLEDPCGAGQRVLKLRDHAGDLVEGLGVLVRVAEEARQSADRDRACHGAERAGKADAGINNIVNDAGKYDEYKEKVKDLTEEIQTRKDTFEKMAEPLVYVCDCYQKFNVVTGMPKSNFGDSFGYDMQKDISSHMTDFYAGKVSRGELNSYFEECCTSMRTYRTSQHQTSGTNEADNTQIVSEMYEVFAKENARAASQANYQEGKALNEKYYSDSHSDWTYYNSDYYYQCNETNAALRESVKQMIEKWDLDEIDCDKIEANSSLTLDGGFDFNSTWNFEFRNQAGRSSLAKESAIPPENFKMFFKEQVTSFTEDNKFNGNLKITIGENNYDLKVPFQTLRTESEGEIRNVWDLMEDYYPKSEDTFKVKNFLGNMSVFTRWYAYETRINDIFGDYEVSHKELS